MGAFKGLTTEVESGFRIGRGYDSRSISHNVRDVTQWRTTHKIDHQIRALGQHFTDALCSSRTGGNEGGTGGFHEFLLGIAGHTDHLKLVNLTNLGSHQPDPATGAEHHHAL